MNQWIACILGIFSLINPSETRGSSQFDDGLSSTFESFSPKYGYYYFRFTSAGTNFEKSGTGIHPGLGVGYRRLAGSGAVDLSFSGLGTGEHKNVEYMWTAPRLSYIHYFTPDAYKSFYLGAGLAWGGFERRLKSEKSNQFVGIFPGISLGYEFLHNEKALGFAELNVCQPALSVYSEGRWPGPTVEFSLGFGF